MKKKCYSLTYLGPNANGGSDFRINSQIWLNALSGLGEALSSEELLGFCEYLQYELRRVWSTASNPGLSSGSGSYTYNGTKDTFTCDPPIGSPTHDRDTGIVVLPFSGRTPHVILPNIRKRQNEIIFDVYRDRPPSKKAFISPQKQEGELYYYQKSPEPLTPGDTAHEVIAYDEDGLDNAENPYYVDVHNTAAHEFGHALGLLDRYHYLAFGYESSRYANSNSKSNWIVRHAGGDAPMYLPGYYDPKIKNGNSFQYKAPPYNQKPYETGSPTPNNDGGNTPQPNFDLNYANHKPHKSAYDIDYTSRFGWMHNIMSRKLGINDPKRLSTNNRFSGEYASVEDEINADPLYLSIYGAEIGDGLPEVVLITETQTRVITDTGGSTTNLSAVGKEIKSKRFEDERAADEGFPKGMFDQYVFIIGTGRAMSTNKSSLTHTRPFIGKQSRDASERGIPTRVLEGILDPKVISNVEDFNRAFYNTNSGGSFVGLLYSSEPNRNGEGADIVCDWEFDQDQNEGIKGINDSMDYRISKMEPPNSSTDPYKWTPKFWNIGSGLDADSFYGFINPGIAAKRSPKSKSRSYLMGRANAGVVVKNIEPFDLENTLFFNIIDNVYSDSFPDYFQNGLDSINNRTLAFGTTDPMRCVQRILKQVISPKDHSIMNGRFKTTNGIFNFAVTDPEGTEKNENELGIFANAGIATPKGRAIWNGYSDDRAPTLPNPGAEGSVSTPATIQKYDRNNLPPSYVYRDILITPWTFKADSKFLRYIISFEMANESEWPKDYALLQKYEIKVRYFSNREIIETIVIPS